MSVTVSVPPVPHKGETLDKTLGETDLGQARLCSETVFSDPEEVSGNG
jgi:hypothetical protein